MLYFDGFFFYMKMIKIEISFIKVLIKLFITNVYDF